MKVLKETKVAISGFEDAVSPKRCKIRPRYYWKGTSKLG